MDEDEEIQSHPSVASGSPSPSPSRSNGRITVMVVAAPRQTNNNNALALTLPNHHQLARSNGGGGREDCWSEGATGVLIDAWGERYLELSRGNLKQKHWKEVADIVSSRDDYKKSAKTDIQCKNRIDTVKKKYKLEKAKIVAGSGSSKWMFFERLDYLIGPTSKIPPLVSGSGGESGKVPFGIPVRTSGSNPFRFQQGKLQMKSNQAATRSSNQNVKVQLWKRGLVETESSEEEEDEDDGFPLEKRPRVVQRGVNVIKGAKERKGWGSSIRMLTQAMLKFGEAYEQAESTKLQQVVEMEKARMKFAMELELQRMQFFMKT